MSCQKTHKFKHKIQLEEEQQNKTQNTKLWKLPGIYQVEFSLDLV